MRKFGPYVGPGFFRCNFSPDFDHNQCAPRKEKKKKRVRCPSLMKISEILSRFVELLLFVCVYVYVRGLFRALFNSANATCLCGFVLALALPLGPKSTNLAEFDGRGICCGFFNYVFWGVIACTFLISIVERIHNKVLKNSTTYKKMHFFFMYWCRYSDKKPSSRTRFETELFDYQTTTLPLRQNV